MRRLRLRGYGSANAEDGQRSNIEFSTAAYYCRKYCKIVLAYPVKNNFHRKRLVK